MDQSTRLSILEHALTDVVERLAEMPPGTDVNKLRALAASYGQKMEEWEETPPDEETRVALLKNVLDLNVEVIRASGGKSPKLAGDLDDEVTNQFPRAVR